MLEMGCASTQAGGYLGAKRNCSAYIHVADSDSYVTNARWANSCIKAVDGRDSVWGGKLTPGEHIITVRTTWSNWCEDETDLVLDALAAARYEVFALEVRSEQEGEVTMQRLSTCQRIQRICLAPLATAIGYIRSPFFLVDVFQALVNPPTSRPAGKGCFVWVEEDGTRQFIDGTRPYGLADTTVTSASLGEPMNEPDGGKTPID